MAQLNAVPRRGKRHSVHLDMTPMVDLAFLLLTFFVLTMTINEQHILEMQMPEQDVKTDPPPVRRERVLTLLLGGANKIYYFLGSDPVQTTDYSREGIRTVLAAALIKRHDLIVLIKPTSRSRYQNLVSIIDEMMFARMKRYYLVKETREDRRLIAEATR
jgi:biopolymer transport protein ExbD